MILKPEDYYTQRNNKFDPFNACMNTTRVMFYKAIGVEYMHSNQMVDDDYFYSLLNSPRAIDYRDKKYPNLKNYNPTEIHGMYQWLDEQVIGHRIASFETGLTWEDFVHQMDIGKPVMTSGSFPEIAGHAFLVCGYKNGELQIADPWGDYRVNYAGSRGTKGYDVRMSREDFELHVKPGKNKWGHCVC